MVPSPDGRRVLARPNGLAGWALPVVPLPGDGWDEASLDAARRLVGAPVRPVRPVGEGAWQLEALDRVPAVGVTWIAPEEAGRLGADAGTVLRWAALDEG